MRSIVSSSMAFFALDVYGHLISGMQSEVLDLIDELDMPVAYQID